jgi:1,4-dihydroxy-2-naphthoate octaprenyltransferase
MNCCDEYGDCRQGRDCPARQSRVPVRYDSGWKRLDAVLSAIAYGISVLGLLCFAALANWAFWFFFMGVK